MEDILCTCVDHDCDHDQLVPMGHAALEEETKSSHEVSSNERSSLYWAKAVYCLQEVETLT
jgi:hypothetical protein